MKLSLADEEEGKTGGAAQGAASAAGNGHANIRKPREDHQVDKLVKVLRVLNLLGIHTTILIHSNGKR